MYIPNSLWTWSFLLVTIVQGIVVIGLEAYAFAIFQQNLLPGPPQDQSIQAPPAFPGLPPVYRFVYTRTVPTFLALYIFAVIYQVILVVDALRMRNIIQVIGLAILNILLCAYGAVQTVQFSDAIHQLTHSVNSDAGPAINYDTYNDLKPIAVAVVCIFFGGTLLLCGVAWKLYQEFAWTIYKSISADLRMKRRFLFYQVYIAMLKFDFFFFLGYSVQWIIVLQASPTQEHDAEFPITIVAVPVSIVILLLAAWVVRRESTVGTVAVMILYLAGLAYFIFKVVRIWSPGPQRAYYQAIAKPLTVFAAIDIALLVLTIAVCIKCAMNFRQGLRAHLSSGSVRKADLEESKMYQPNEMANLNHQGTAPMPSRMTIE